MKRAYSFFVWIDTINAAQNSVLKAENSKTQEDVDAARVLVDKVEDPEIKENLNERLDRVQTYIDNLKVATDSVIHAENTKEQTDINNAEKLVHELPDDEEKEKLQERIDNLRDLINSEMAAINAVTNAENTKATDDINSAQKLVDKLPESTLKDELQNRLDTLINNISNLEKAKNAVSKAETTKSQSDVDYARELVAVLPDGIEKNELTNRLNKVQSEIDKLANATQAVEKAESSKSLGDINNAQTLVDGLIDSPEKTNLQERLDNIKQYVSQVNEVEKAVSKAETTKSQSDIDIAQNLVDELPEGAEKDAFQKRLDNLKSTISSKNTLEELLTQLEQTRNPSLIDDVQKLIDELKDGSTKYNYQKRLDYVKELIDNINKAKLGVEKAESTKSQVDVNSAQVLIDVLPDCSEKTELQNRLDAVQDYINLVKDAINSVTKAERTHTQNDIDSARAKVNQLEEGSIKTELTNRLDAIQSGVDNSNSVISAIEKAEESLSQEDVDAARKLIEDNNIKDSSLISRLDKVQKYIDDLKAAREAVEKAERTKLQTDKNYAVPLVEAVSQVKYPVEKADFLRRLQVVQDYINSVNDATYDVSKSEIQQDKNEVDNAKDTVSTLPSADSEIGLENKPCINPDEDATTDKDKLQSSLNKTETYLNDVEIADKAVKKQKTV